MSETNTNTPPGETRDPPPAPEYVPTHVLSSDPDPEPDKPEPDKPAEEPEKPAEPAKPEKTPEEKRAEAEDRRYRTLYAQRYAEKARADAAEAARADLQERIRQLENPGQANQPAPSDIDRLVAERAEQVVANRESQARFEKWDAAGIAEYGRDAFRDACATVGQIASDPQRQMLVAIATDMEGGHRAVAAMANDPEEATRILAMPPHRMALAMNKLAAADPAPAATPVAQSRAPAPIQPPSGGRARGEPDPNGSYADYQKWSERQQWARQ